MLSNKEIVRGLVKEIFPVDYVKLVSLDVIENETFTVSTIISNEKKFEKLVNYIITSSFLHDNKIKPKTYIANQLAANESTLAKIFNANWINFRGMLDDYIRMDLEYRFEYLSEQMISEDDLPVRSFKKALVEVYPSIDGMSFEEGITMLLNDGDFYSDRIISNAKWFLKTNYFQNYLKNNDEFGDHIETMLQFGPALTINDWTEKTILENTEISEYDNVKISSLLNYFLTPDFLLTNYGSFEIDGNYIEDMQIAGLELKLEDIVLLSLIIKQIRN